MRNGYVFDGGGSLTRREVLWILGMSAQSAVLSAESVLMSAEFWDVLSIGRIVR